MARKAATAPKRAKPDAAQQVIDHALDLAAREGWRALSLTDIARAAKLPMSRLYALYPSKAAILDAFLRRLDMQVLAAVDREPPEGSARDRLFDVLMHRFEALEPYRGAVASIVSGARRDPVMALAGLPQFLRSMACMLEAAGLPAAGLAGTLRVHGLAAIYLATLRTWLQDESEDRARTMATLDAQLRRAERWAERVGRRAGATRAGAPA